MRVRMYLGSHAPMKEVQRGVDVERYPVQFSRPLVERLLKDFSASENSILIQEHPRYSFNLNSDNAGLDIADIESLKVFFRMDESSLHQFGLVDRVYLEPVVDSYIDILLYSFSHMAEYDDPIQSSIVSILSELSVVQRDAALVEGLTKLSYDINSVFILRGYGHRVSLSTFLSAENYSYEIFIDPENRDYLEGYDFSLSEFFSDRVLKVRNAAGSWPISSLVLLELLRYDHDQLLSALNKQLSLNLTTGDYSVIIKAISKGVKEALNSPFRKIISSV